MTPMLSIIIPAYNEEKNVAAVVHSLRQHLAQCGYADTEIVLVNDGSSDETGSIVRALAANESGIVFVDHQRNRGIGAAIRSGLAKAKGDYICVSSADGEIGPDDIANLYRLADGADLVTSSRRRVGLQHRNVMSQIHNLLTLVLFGYNLNGREGIYVIRRYLLDDLKIVSDTSLANLEVLSHAAHRATSVRHGEITVRARLSGKSKVANMRAILRVMKEMVLLRIKKWIS